MLVMVLVMVHPWRGQREVGLEGSEADRGVAPRGMLTPGAALWLSHGVPRVFVHLWQGQREVGLEGGEV